MLVCENIPLKLPFLNIVCFYARSPLYVAPQVGGSPVPPSPQRDPHEVVDVAGLDARVISLVDEEAIR
jgi:hypothetical protein